MTLYDKRTQRRIAWPAALSVWLMSGCATTMPAPARTNIAELADVRFFPQSAYDCGPAALATILDAAGVVTTPQQLVDRVYVDGLNGSLQAELMAATRRAHRVPVAIPPTFESLLDEVASGRPVLVLLNLGLSRIPAWHYAVVVGFDADTDRVILRSGENPRLREPTQRFLRQWQRADHWAFVAARPDEVPVSASADRFLRAVVDAQPQLGSIASLSAYDAALARWPGNPLALFLAANSKFAATQLAEAASLYAELLAQEPDHAAARNNLALVLLDQGCPAQALREARLALASARAGPFRAEIEDTLTQIERAADNHASDAVCGEG